MSRRLRYLALLLSTAMLAALGAWQVPASAAGPAQAGLSGTAQTGIVGAVPAANTPNIVDGTDSSGASYRVFRMAQVGSQIVVVGTFARVQNGGRPGDPNGKTVYNRTNVFAYDQATGDVNPGFNTVINGPVDAVAAGPNGTVYLGGKFNLVNGAAARNLVQVSMSTGRTIAAFNPPVINGAIDDLAVSGSRVFVAGNFTAVGTTPHGGLATLTTFSGHLDPYMSINVAGHHNYPRGRANAPVGVSKIDISPDGTQMVAIGNFKTMGTYPRDQVGKIVLRSGGAVVDAGWATAAYTPACNASAFDSYIRSVQWAPDGTYFVITATGGPNPGTLCDTAARWNATVADQSTAAQPYWVAITGGDSLWSVAVTGSAIYVGGHQRWLNNPLGKDNAAPGAVPRPGIAALDPLSGVPLTWNPGRQPRGIGTQALLATSTGLYVGSDTDYFGNFVYQRNKFAFFPLAGGTPPPSQNTGTLPGNVYLAGRPVAQAAGGVDDVVTRSYDGATTAGSDSTLVSNGAVPWSTARGAFMAGSTLYYALPDTTTPGTYDLVRRSFDGTSFGPPDVLTWPYHDPTWMNVQTGSGQTYDGVFPSFYTSDLAKVTGMFYASGRLYYAMTGSTSLFYRNFSVDSGIVGATAFTAVPNGFGAAGGMFVANGFLYVADRTTGNLSKMGFSNGAVTGPATVVSGPAAANGGKDWRATALFIGSH